MKSPQTGQNVKQPNKWIVRPVVLVLSIFSMCLPSCIGGYRYLLDEPPVGGKASPATLTVRQGEVIPVIRKWGAPMAWGFMPTVVCENPSVAEIRHDWQSRDVSLKGLREGTTRAQFANAMGSLKYDPDPRFTQFIVRVVPAAPDQSSE